MTSARHVLLVALLALAAAAPTARAASTPSPERAVELLNEWRAKVGEQPVAHDPAKSSGCAKHANYHRLNPDTTGHFEQNWNPGYTREGHDAAASSVLAYGPGLDDGPLIWEGAVYHRMSLLDPRLATTGYWSEFELACMGSLDEAELRTEPQLTFHPYPYDGQQDVATSFDCRESPNPCEQIPGWKRGDESGFIPSLQFNGPWPSHSGADVRAATLTPDGGAPVAMTVDHVLSEYWDMLDGGMSMIPHRSLAPGTWYTASVQGELRLGDIPDDSYGVVPFAFTWRFRTAIADPESVLSAERTTAARRCRGLLRCVPTSTRTRLRFRSLSPVAANVRALRTATGEATTASIAQGATADLDLAPGRYRVCFTQPAGGGYSATESCFMHSARGYPQLRLAPTATRTADGRKLRVALATDDPALRGRKATVVAYRTKRVCGPRSPRRAPLTGAAACEQRRWGPATVRTVVLRRGGAAVAVPAPFRGQPTHVHAVVKAFAIGDARYEPEAPVRLYARPTIA